MDTHKFSIISNPPFGKQVMGKSDLMHYPGYMFEYKAIEMGAILGAYDGAFLIPQQSAPFRLTGNHSYGVEHESYKSKEYYKFIEHTRLKIVPNIGYSTEIYDEEEQGKGWKDVSIITEIAIVEYDELDYKPKSLKTQKIEFPPVITEDPSQLKMF